MATPIETYRGVDIFHTSDLTLVHTPAQFAFACVLRESDEGPVLTMEASVETVRSEIDAALAECAKPLVRAA